MNKLVTILLLSISFGSPSVKAFLSLTENSVFPKKVSNSCYFSWTGDEKKFVVGQVNVLVDLKNAEGGLEERAYIYIDCRGHFAKLDKHPFYDFKNPSTSCTGVRINRLDDISLKVGQVFPITSESIEVKSSPSDSKLILEWEGASIFEIENDQSFSWSMKSKLSGKTHKGFTSCK